MNIQKLKNCIFYRVRIRPAARSIPPRQPNAPSDDTWIVMAVGRDGTVELSNTTTGHVARIGSDHIHHFDSDPPSETDGVKHGFLTLTVQVFMSGARLWVEPLLPYARRGL